MAQTTIQRVDLTPDDPFPNEGLPGIEPIAGIDADKQ